MDTRDRMVEKVKVLAQDTAEHTQTDVEETQRAVVTEVKDSANGIIYQSMI